MDHHRDHNMHGEHAGHAMEGTTIGNMAMDTHNHQHMSHDHMTHANMQNGSGGMHEGHGMMPMYFHFTLGDFVLFEFWKVDNYGGLISSMLGIFIAAMLYEGLKYFREYLYWKNYNMLQYQTVNKPTNQETERVINKPSLLTVHHIVQTLLHVIQIFVSYLLMLIFMTYNVWLCMAVVLGSGTGYFLFGWRKSLFVDVTEHCH